MKTQHFPNTRTMTSTAFVFFMILLIHRSLSFGLETITSIFTTESSKSVCDLSERLQLGCSLEVTEAQSFIHCTLFCLSDETCIGVSVEGSGNCFIHRECPLISGCTIPHSNHQYVTKHCEHGSWEGLTKSCVCVDGFHGDRCNQTYATCEDLLTTGYDRGTYRVYLNPQGTQTDPFLVQCYVNPQAMYANLAILKNTGVHNFNRTWQEYQTGFYYDQNNLWAGLHVWHQMAKFANCTEVVYHVIVGSSGVYNSLHGFTLEESYDRYSFSYEYEDGVSVYGGFSMSSTHTNCLSALQNIPFSTWDVDNDQNSEENCAAQAGSGWWFSGSCTHICNFLGIGYQSFGENSIHHLYSFSGVDMNQYSSQQPSFEMYLKCNSF